MDKNIYRTLKGYEIIENNRVTPAMEDYLEMIYRCIDIENYVRINNLATKLNVKPSSASKMVNNLKELGYIDYEKYGIIVMTEKGIELGKYLLERHNIINKFFCLINNSNDETEQTEKVEHFINKETIHNMAKLIEVLNKGTIHIKNAENISKD